ncbi:MAG: hypothetical protein JRI59_03150, partial [Deltaproteobacteria bacterium]|nr:hypothetical protein [Deltaproteobacteria bacterium]
LTTLYLFIYMGLSGGVLLILFSLFKKSLWVYLKNLVLSWVLLRPHGSGPGLRAQSPNPDKPASVPGFPYGLALAAGMAVLLCRALL